MRGAALVLAASLAISACKMGVEVGAWRLESVDGVPVTNQEFLYLHSDGRFEMPGGTGAYKVKRSAITLQFDCAGDLLGCQASMEGTFSAQRIAITCPNIRVYVPALEL